MTKLHTKSIKNRGQRKFIKLVCPDDQKPLQHTSTGKLICEHCGQHFEFRNNIGRFVKEIESGQQQVLDCFDYKWKRGSWGFAEEHKKVMGSFFRDRFLFISENHVEEFFSGKTVLHAGVGNGHDEQYYLHHCKEVWGADISTSVDALQINWSANYPSLFKRFNACQADLMALPFEDGSFDIVLSDGVLHHTPNTFKALEAVSKKASVGGFVMFYIYLKKAPIREFVDDFIREQITHLSPDEAWEKLEPLTAFAKELSREGQQIKIPKDFELLGIKGGNFNLQRWMYWNIFKFYWNDSFSFDENNHINYDWYYPKYAWRHTPEEVRGWLGELRLEENIFNVTDSGICVIAKKLD